MKRFLRIAVIALFTLFYGDLSAQVKFFELSHDFGEIAEEGGNVEHTFRFRNASSEPVVVVATHTSCGCTKAEFPRKPIMPDSVAAVKVVFSPMNYPGAFARKITIVTNRGALKGQLMITGRVIPRVKSLEEQYPIVLGEGVRAEANSHSFGYVEHGKMAQSSFDIVNTSKRSIALSVMNPYPELEFYFPATLGAGERAAVNFGCLLPENSNVYGSLSYSVSLVINGKQAHYPFNINGLAIDNREENSNNRPQMIVLSEKFIKFGAVNCDVAKLSREIEVQNLGDRAIEIRKLEILSDGFAADIEGSSTIEAGAKRKIKVEAYPSQLPFGAVVERLRIVSNDPKMPVLTIRVSAIVER